MSLLLTVSSERSSWSHDLPLRVRNRKFLRSPLSPHYLPQITMTWSKNQGQPRATHDARNHATKGSPDTNKNKVTLCPFGDPPSPQRAKRAHLFSGRKKCVNCNKCILQQNSLCLGYWLSSRSFTIVDCESQILHIKPPCLQVCTQITFCAQFVGAHSPFPSDLRPWWIWAEKGYWRWRLPHPKCGIW